MIDIVLADDQDLVREGLRTILTSEHDIQVVGEADNGHDAIREARRRRPDVVVMDVRMPRVDGIEATRQLLDTTGPTPKVLVLTTFDLDEYVYAALRAGASGFALKSAPRHQLIAAVRTVADGDLVLAPAITARLVERFADPATSEADVAAVRTRLSARELEVFILVARGLTNAEIAAELHLATTTVKTHLSSLLTKLGRRDRVQLVITAYEYGLVRPSDLDRT